MGERERSFAGACLWPCAAQQPNNLLLMASLLRGIAAAFWRSLTNRSISTACEFRWGLVVEKRRQTWPAALLRCSSELHGNRQMQRLCTRTRSHRL